MKRQTNGRGSGSAQPRSKILKSKRDLRAGNTRFERKARTSLRSCFEHIFFFEKGRRKTFIKK